MGIINKIFRAKTIGMAEASLEIYFHIRTSFPAEINDPGSSFKMPVQVFAANRVIASRAFPNNIILSVASLFMKTNMEAMLKNGEKPEIREGVLIGSLLAALFTGENESALSFELLKFMNEVSPLIASFGARYGIDLDAMVDMKFLENMGISFSAEFERLNSLKKTA